MYVRRGSQISNSLYAVHVSTWPAKRHFIGAPSATVTTGKTRFCCTQGCWVKILLGIAVFLRIMPRHTHIKRRSLSSFISVLLLFVKYQLLHIIFRCRMDRSSKKSSSQRRPRPPTPFHPPPPYEGTEEPESSNPIIIAVFGKTGTGKSSFIKGVTGQDLKIGHGLESCQQIQASE